MTSLEPSRSIPILFTSADHLRLFTDLRAMAWRDSLGLLVFSRHGMPSQIPETFDKSSSPIIQRTCRVGSGRLAARRGRELPPWKKTPRMPRLGRLLSQ